MCQSGGNNKLNFPLNMSVPPLDSRNSCDHPHLISVLSGQPEVRLTHFPSSERWSYISDRIMGFGVYRSDPTLAASLALVHRYPSGVSDWLPVSSSEYRHLHPAYL